MANLFVLMFLLMFICALLGMQTFGGTAISVESRWHFDYIYPAMLTVFGIYTGGWVDAFQACSSEVGVATSALFFVPTLIIGFFIIMNLFIAILLEAFSGDDEVPMMITRSSFVKACCLYVSRSFLKRDGPSLSVFFAFLPPPAKNWSHWSK